MSTDNSPDGIRQQDCNPDPSLASTDKTTSSVKVSFVISMVQGQIKISIWKVSGLQRRLY